MAGEISNDDIVKTIQKTLMTKVVEFKPRGGEIWRVRPLYETKSKDNFASILYVADTHDAVTDKEVSLIVKVMPTIPHWRILQNSEIQFYNEGMMLTSVVAKLVEYSGAEDVAALFPRCFYSAEDADVGAIIVMDNLKVQGFTLPGYLMDYDHCRLSLIALAKYHAMGYAAKRNHLDKFMSDVVAPFKEARYLPHNRAYQNHDFGFCARDPIHYILNSSEDKWIQFRNKNKDFLTRLLEICQSPVEHLTKINEPLEPLATLCHGDFNRNNIMFQYVDGKPTTVKFVDFQTVRYATPGTDLAFFFHLNTSHDLRVRHLDDLLSVYQSTLVESLTVTVEASREELESVYSLAAIRADFERCILAGYVIVALFGHFMLASVEELQVMEQKRSLETEGELTSIGYLECVLKLGGDEAMTRSLAMITEMASMTF